MTSTTTAPRWVDSTGAAWPVTGDWCAICAMPLLVTEPGQTSHPNCEDFPDVPSSTDVPDVEDRCSVCAEHRSARGLTARCRRSFHAGSDVEDRTLSDVEDLADVEDGRVDQ